MAIHVDKQKQSLLMLMVLVATMAMAQPSSSAKVEFADVVAVTALTKDMLFQNAKRYTQSLKREEETFRVTSVDSLNGKVTGESTYYVYSQSGLFKKISGTITYHISLEVKDNKYRYLFSDFVFAYYKQDRTYNMVPTGKKKSLDDLVASGWQKLWNSHHTFTTNKMKRNISQLALIMAENPIQKEAEVVKKIEW